MRLKIKKHDIYSLIIFAYLFVKLNMLSSPFIYYTSDYAMLVFSILHWGKHKKNGGKDYKHLLWYFIFYIFCLISKSWAINTLYVQQVLVLMKGLIITIFVLTEYISDFNNWKAFLKIFVYACLLHGCYAVITTPASDFGTNLFGAQTGYYFNNIAQVIAFGVCVAVYLFYEEQKKWWLLLIAIMCSFIGITGSRKAILMVIASISIFILFSKQHTNKRIGQIFIAIIVTLVLYYYIMNNEFLYMQIGSRLSNVFAIFGRNNAEADYSTLERLYFIAQGWKLFINNIIHGVGINNFKAYVGGYLGSGAKYAHNNYIELLADGGIIGFILYYVRYLELLVRSVKCKMMSKYKNTSLLILVLMIMLLVLEFGNVTYYFVQYQMVLIIVCSYFKIRRIEVNV